MLHADDDHATCTVVGSGGLRTRSVHSRISLGICAKRTLANRAIALVLAVPLMSHRDAPGLCKLETVPKPSGKCSLKFALVSDLQVNDTQGGCCLDVSSSLY